MISMENKFLNKNLFLRIISAIIMIVISGFCLTRSSFTFSIFILVVTIVSYLEWFTVVSNNLDEQKPESYKKYMIFWGVLGLIAILPSSASMLYLKDINGTQSIVYIISIIAATDIGAYFFGKSIGGPKLAPSISPGKTISGSIFGILSSIIIGSIFYFIEYFKEMDLSYSKLILITLIVSILSQIGDLLESAFKRKFGVKDSSNLIPGHGGFLDRIDGFLLSMPFFAIMHFMNFIK
jgi:phosphatidate cytidylyltransferase